MLMFERPYDYFEAVDADVLEYIQETYSTDELKQRYKDEQRYDLLDEIYDECFVSDSVTGNASGSYWCNAWKAEQCLAGNHSLLCDAIENLGADPADYRRALESPELADCMIRCHVLSECVERVINHVSVAIEALVEADDFLSSLDEPGTSEVIA